MKIIKIDFWCEDLNLKKPYTISYSEEAKGWPSFYSFLPDFMIGMNSYFYTFKNGKNKSKFIESEFGKREF